MAVDVLVGTGAFCIKVSSKQQVLPEAFAAVFANDILSVWHRAGSPGYKALLVQPTALAIASRSSSVT